MRRTVFLICIFQLPFAFTIARILPKNMASPCSQSEPNYNECMETTLKEWGPILLNGNPQLGFPSLNPLKLNNIFVMNRTLNNFVSLAVVLRDIEIWGFNTLDLESFKLNKTTKEGELHLKIYDLYPKWNFESTGTLFNIDLKNEGLFMANASVIDLQFDFKLKKFEKLGIEYYGFEKFNTKNTIDNAYIKIIPKNSFFQYTADLITNFFNENPKRTLTAAQGIYEESANVFYRQLGEQLLSAIPANEILPE